MNITSRPVANKPEYRYVTIVVDRDLEVMTYNVEMKYHHILSVNFTRRSNTGLLLNAGVGATLPIAIENELMKWYGENFKK